MRRGGPACQAGGGTPRARLRCRRRTRSRPAGRPYGAPGGGSTGGSLRQLGPPRQLCIDLVCDRLLISDPHGADRCSSSRRRWRTLMRRWASSRICSCLQDWRATRRAGLIVISLHTLNLQSCYWQNLHLARTWFGNAEILTDRDAFGFADAAAPQRLRRRRAPGGCVPPDPKPAHQPGLFCMGWCADLEFRGSADCAADREDWRELVTAVGLVPGHALKLRKVSAHRRDHARALWFSLLSLPLPLPWPWPWPLPLPLPWPWPWPFPEPPCPLPFPVPLFRCCLARFPRLVGAPAFLRRPFRRPLRPGPGVPGSCVRRLLGQPSGPAVC